MTDVYLAYGSASKETLLRHAENSPVALLVAVPFVRDFMKHRGNMNIRTWCLDSGAFSAHNSGRPITYEQWRDVAQTTDADEIFGLDVIQNATATRDNLERAWADGIAAIPTYHFGSPPEALAWCCERSNKIALGGAARMQHNRRRAWMLQCFARVWPKKIHGFACASREALAAMPFHSVDASSWTLAPAAMGQWCGFTGKQISLKSKGCRDYWVEVEEHHKRERMAKWRWRRELAQLNSEKNK